MYLDAKRILWGICGLILGLMAWMMTSMKNAATEEMIREIETGIPSGKKLEQQFEVFETSFAESKSALEKGDYRQAASRLRNAYYPIENIHLSARSESFELPSGQLFSAWLDAKKAQWHKAMEQAYPVMRTGLEQGRLPEETVEGFFRGLPEVFASEWRTRFKGDRPEIEAIRAEQAGNWVLLRVGASLAHGREFEEPLYPVLRNLWPEEAPYRLVFGRPMSREEEQNAAGILQFFISGEKARYAEEGAANAMAGYDLLETVTLEIVDRTKNREAPDLNWTELEPISVTHEPAESFYFELEHERQSIDFDGVRKKQRAALIPKLRRAVRENLPRPVFTAPR